MRAGWIIAAIATLGVAACDTVPMTPANQQAEAIGSPVLHFARGLPAGFLKVTMPDGENLAGRFNVDENGATLVSHGGAGNFSATARGPRTSMVCHGDMLAGHGTAQCQTQNGAVFRMPL